MPVPVARRKLVKFFFFFVVRSAWVTDPFADATICLLLVSSLVGGERDELTMHVFLAAAVGGRWSMRLSM